MKKIILAVILVSNVNSFAQDTSKKEDSSKLNPAAVAGTLGVGAYAGFLASTGSIGVGKQTEQLGELQTRLNSEVRTSNKYIRDGAFPLTLKIRNLEAEVATQQAHIDSILKEYPRDKVYLFDQRLRAGISLNDPFDHPDDYVGSKNKSETNALLSALRKADKHRIIRDDLKSKIAGLKIKRIELDNAAITPRSKIARELKEKVDVKQAKIINMLKNRKRGLLIGAVVAIGSGSATLIGNSSDETENPLPEQDLVDVAN